MRDHAQLSSLPSERIAKFASYLSELTFFILGEVNMSRLNEEHAHDLDFVTEAPYLLYQLMISSCLLEERELALRASDN